MSSPGWPATLVHEELRLRPMRYADADSWREARERNRDWLIPWDATVPPGSEQRPASFRDLVRVLRRQARLGSSLPFALEVEERFAGQVTVNNIIRGSAQSASVGYWIDQAYAGRGVIPRAVAMVVDHCFFEVGLHRVEIAIRPENSNSLRVVEKLQLGEVGFAPRFLHINGEWRDHRIFAVTREEAPSGLIARL